MSTMRSKSPYSNEKISPVQHHFRLNLLIIMVIVFSLTLILRLGYLQFSQYKRFATLSLKNQMSLMPIAPTRGVIADRRGIVLADNIPVYALEIIPERVKDLSNSLLQLKKLLPSITDDDIDNFETTRKHNRAYESIPLKLKLTQEEVAIFASTQYKFPGISIKARLMRYYPLAEKTAHLLGYVGRLSIQDLQQVNSTNYRASTFIGKTGIEKFYENKLHGQVGYQHVETDVSGRTLRILSKQAPIPGAKMYLTIDAELQQEIHSIMKDKRGAVVVINPQNGELLSMVSTPSYDPNLFTNGISNKKYNKLAHSTENPLFNRAIRGLYPPASTIKPFLALAGLDRELITADLSIYDQGWFKVTGASHIYHDWKRAGHGFVNLKRAITVSCDTYFYQLGNKMGISIIEDILGQFGFGQLSKVDLPEEAKGLVPNPSWKKNYRNASWYTGDTIITTIGQGSMMASPLQLANATASISKHGQRFRPHLLGKWEDGQGKKHHIKLFEEYPITIKHHNYWNIITDAMQAVISSKEGTGHRFGHDAPYTVAAKTGTAQVYNESSYDKKRYEDTPIALRDHSLFIGFAPVEKPEIAIAVLVEHDYVASNIARKVMDAYFKLKKERTS